MNKNKKKLICNVIRFFCILIVFVWIGFQNFDGFMGKQLETLIIDNSDFVLYFFVLSVFMYQILELFIEVIFWIYDFIKGRLCTSGT